MILDKNTPTCGSGGNVRKTNPNSGQVGYASDGLTATCQTGEASLRSRAMASISRQSLLQRAKSMGFSDRQIATLVGSAEDEVRALRKKIGLVPSYRLVDTCAAEFEAYTPYYYSTYDT